jgi:hypothetical protein
MDGLRTVEAPSASAFQQALAAAVRSSPIQTEPFPFIYGRMPADPAMFAALRERFPAQNEASKSLGEYAENHRSIVKLDEITEPGCARFWNGLLSAGFKAEFGRLLLEKFLPFIPQYRRYGLVARAKARLDRRLATVYPPLDARERRSLLSEALPGTWILTGDEPGYALPPHTDHPRKMVTFLLYLSENGGGAQLPGTSIYSPHEPGLRSWDSVRVDRSEFTEVFRASHVEGHFLAFAKSDITWHGVEASLSNGLRRTLNLTLHRPAHLGG